MTQQNHRQLMIQLTVQIMDSNRLSQIGSDKNILLHHFHKKSQKTPRREIERAKAERDDYLARKEANS